MAGGIRYEFKNRGIGPRGECSQLLRLDLLLRGKQDGLDQCSWHSQVAENLFQHTMCQQGMVRTRRQGARVITVRTSLIEKNGTGGGFLR